MTLSPSAGRTTSVPVAPPAGAVAGAGAAGAAGASATGAGAAGAAGASAGAAGASAAAGAGAAAGAPLPSSMIASSAPTSTVSSSATLMDARMPAGRGRDLGVDLVGRHLEQGLVGLDSLALGLQPARDSALGDALAERRKGYGNRHGFSCS
ncbi:hypothetical protein QFZ67_005753 [Streptomyces sp. V1I1]|nr:hypothetical protein [Streptomyces sp. V1I1]